MNKKNNLILITMAQLSFGFLAIITFIVFLFAWPEYKKGKLFKNISKEGIQISFLLLAGWVMWFFSMKGREGYSLYCIDDCSRSDDVEKCLEICDGVSSPSSRRDFEQYL